MIKGDPVKKVLLTATVQSHIAQFHRPLAEVLHEHGYELHVAARNNLGEKNGLSLDFADKVFDVPFSRSPKSPDNVKAYFQLKKIGEEKSYRVGDPVRVQCIAADINSGKIDFVLAD